MNFISISKKFLGDDGQVPYSKVNYFGNEKFSKTHSKKAVLDMSNNQTSHLGDLTQMVSGEPGLTSEGHRDVCR